MTEDIIFKRRNKLRKHFVNTSNVLLYGYKKLSGEAKITFQVIESFDWEDKETGDSKGYVFPAIKTLAEIRDTSERTIYRHIKDLESTGLLTRQRRSHKASILFIEDVSEDEAKIYLEKYVNKAKKADSFKNSNDKNVKSLEASQLTKMSVDNIKEKELKKENEINVNANFKFSSQEKNGEKRHGMQGLQDIMKRFDIVKPKSVLHEIKKPKVNSKQNPEEKMKRDYYAEQLATELQDEKSLGCYRSIVEKVPQHIIYDTLGSVKELWKEGKIKKSRGALFVDIIKNYCDKKNIELGFNVATP